MSLLNNCFFHIPPKPNRLSVGPTRQKQLIASMMKNPPASRRVTKITSVSLPPGHFQKIDEAFPVQGFETRAQYILNLIREDLVSVGAYDHYDAPAEDETPERIGVSMSETLRNQVDERWRDAGFDSRSHYVQELIRKRK